MILRTEDIEAAAKKLLRPILENLRDALDRIEELEAAPWDASGLYAEQAKRIEELERMTKLGSDCIECEKKRQHIKTLKSETLAIYEWLEEHSPSIATQLRADGLFPTGDDGQSDGEQQGTGASDQTCAITRCRSRRTDRGGTAEQSDG